MTAGFGDRLAAAARAAGAPLALGLDPHLDRLPRPLQARFLGRTGRAWREAAAEGVLEFGVAALDAAAGQVAAVKPQFAFYEQLGAPGWAALEETCRAARERGLLVIADAKRGDISSTGAAYAAAILDPEGPIAADAVTLSPWLGLDTLEPFLPWCRDAGSGIFALVRTTNPGSALLQRPLLEPLARALGELSARFKGESGLSAVGAVVGAQADDDARRLRELLPAAWFLVPGVGAQGGELAAALAGRRADGLGSLVVCSRALLYPPAPGDAYDADPTSYIRGQLANMRQDLIAF